MARMLVYLWAAPTSLLGLVAGCLTLITGGKVEKHDGVLEFHGGFARWFLRSPMVRARAMTLGHVVLGLDLNNLHDSRAHEHAHVRQAELFGPFFLPAYGVATGWALIRGKHYYRDNWFEIDADRRCGG